MSRDAAGNVSNKTVLTLIREEAQTDPGTGTPGTGGDAFAASHSKLVLASIDGVGSEGWTHVDLPGSYDNLVVVATGAYGPDDAPAVVRLRNVGGDGFELRVQSPGDRETLTGYTVHFLAVEAGVYTEAEHGFNLEASTLEVGQPAGKFAGWSRVQSVGYGHPGGFTAPVVLGQVQSSNDERWSTFIATGATRGEAPDASTLRVGYQIGEDTDTQRAPETVGWVVLDSGTQTIEGLEVLAGVGPNVVRGFSTNASGGHRYDVDGPAGADVALASVAGLNGADGGWPVLFTGSGDAVGQTGIRLVFDEDQALDLERGHAAEEVAFLLAKQGQAGGG